MRLASVQSIRVRDQGKHGGCVVGLKLARAVSSVASMPPPPPPPHTIMPPKMLQPHKVTTAIPQMTCQNVKPKMPHTTQRTQPLCHSTNEPSTEPKPECHSHNNSHHNQTATDDLSTPHKATQPKCQTTTAAQPHNQTKPGSRSLKAKMPQPQLWLDCHNTRECRTATATQLDAKKN